MFRFSLIGILFISFILAACAGAASQATQPWPSPTTPADTPLPAGSPSPDDTAVSPPYPAGDESPLPAWYPAPGDENLKRGEAFIDSADILTLESFPLQFMLHLEGSLPTPCHQLRVEVGEPDAQNRIDVEVYSVSDPDEVCIQVLQSFEENIPLGSFPSGTYAVYVNGEKVGEFTA